MSKVKTITVTLNEAQIDCLLAASIKAQESCARDLVHPMGDHEKARLQGLLNQADTAAFMAHSWNKQIAGDKV